MDGLFNNREIAVGLWLIALIAFVISKASVRGSLVDVLRSALVPKILIPLVLSFVPTTLIIGVLAFSGLWDLSVLKETIYWVIGTGLVMFGGFTKVKSIKALYKKTAKDTLVLVAVLEFLVWFYVFALWVELLLIPFTTLVVLLATVAKYHTANGIELTRKFLNGLQVFVGLLILSFAVIALVGDPKPLFTYQNLELFLLPIVLSFAYAPSVYLLALYSNYELVFNRINHNLMLNSKDKRILKLAVIRRCSLNVHVAGEMIRHLAINLNNKTTKAQALKFIQAFDPTEKPSFL